jgi:hypothetical protein
VATEVDYPSARAKLIFGSCGVRAYPVRASARNRSTATDHRTRGEQRWRFDNQPLGAEQRARALVGIASRFALAGWACRLRMPPHLLAMGTIDWKSMQGIGAVPDVVFFLRIGVLPECVIGRIAPMLRTGEA